MSEYVECRECGFVLLSEGPTESEPRPRRVDACPGCSGTEFQFTGA